MGNTAGAYRSPPRKAAPSAAAQDTAPGSGEAPQDGLAPDPNPEETINERPLNPPDGRAVEKTPEMQSSVGKKKAVAPAEPIQEAA
jgi:hypothetical protein